MMAGAASRRRPGGFTLLELMIAILLLVGGVASCAWCFSRAIYATTDAEAMEQAVALAQEKLENLRGTTFASIANEAKAAVTGWTGFSRQVAVTTPLNSNLKQLVVTVYWTPGEAELSTALTTDVVNAS